MDHFLNAAANLPLAHAGAPCARGAGHVARQRGWIRSAGSGYVVESLEAALWCFAQSSSYRDAVLAAANLGHDADTTAAIVGQLAGAFYGAEAIPESWRSRITQRMAIEQMARQLLAMQPS